MKDAKILEFGGYSKPHTVNLFDADTIHDLNVFPYPFKDDSIEKIIMRHTLEHLDNPKRVLEECYRILVNGGRVHIIIPYWKDDMFTNPEHKHYFKKEWFRSLNPKSEKYKNMEKLCRFDFKVIKNSHARGKFRLWKKYELVVVLEARK